MFLPSVNRLRHLPVLDALAERDAAIARQVADFGGRKLTKTEKYRLVGNSGMVKLIAERNVRPALMA